MYKNHTGRRLVLVNLYLFDSHSEERWRSESIQVGGVQSSRGVLGFWFDKYTCSIFVNGPSTNTQLRDYDEHGPAGPTSFWKIHDGIEEKKHPSHHSPMTQFTMPMY